MSHLSNHSGLSSSFSASTVSLPLLPSVAAPAHKKLYQSDKDPRPQTTEVFQRKITEIRQEFESIEQALDLIAFGETGDCESLASSATQEYTRLKQQQDLLPYLRDKVALAANFKGMQSLHALHHFIEKKLCILQQIPDSQELLTLREQCEDWTNQSLELVKGSQDNKVARFGQIVQNACGFIISQHERAKIYDRELFLHLVTLQKRQIDLFEHIVRTLEDGAEPHSIAAIREQLQTILQLDNPYKREMPVHALETTLRRLSITSAQLDAAKKPFKEGFKLIQLQKHHLFACGKSSRLYQVGAIVEALQDQVVKGLLHMRKVVTEHMQVVCQGNLDARYRPSLEHDITFYESILDDLVATLHAQKSAIVSKKATKETAQALDYVYSIQKLVDEVRAQISFFSTLNEQSFRPVAEVLAKLISFLTSRQVDIKRSDTTHDLLEISRLFQTAVLASQTLRPAHPKLFLEHFCAKTLTTIETTIAVAGRQVLTPSLSERQLASKVFAKQTIDDPDSDELPHDIKSYLEKSATHYLYFTNGPSDPIFDLFFYNIEYVDAYQPLHTRSMQKDRTYLQIITSYKAHNPLDHDHEQLSILSDIFMLLEKLEQKIPDDKKAIRAILDVSWYTRLRQLLFHVQSQHSERVQTLYTKALSKLQAYERTAKLPEYAPQLQSISPPNESETVTEHVLTPYLYKLIAQALWSKEEGTRIEASRILLDGLSKLGHHFVPQDKFLLQLLQEFALKRYLLQLKLSESEDTVLSLLMTEYALNSIMQEALRELYPQESLEAAIYLMTSRDNATLNGLIDSYERLRQAVAQSRQQFLKPWQQFMTLYCTFISTADKSTRTRLLDQAKIIADRHTDASEDFKGTLVCCLKHMKKLNS